MNITVVGAGAWGTALAVAAAQQGCAVRLWARDSAQAQAMQSSRCNTRYLPSATLPSGLTVVSGPAADLARLVRGDDLVIVGTPMAALRPTLVALAPAGIPVAWLCKGFEQPQHTGTASEGSTSHYGLLGHEIAAQVAPNLVMGVLSGPSFAKEVAAGLPTALVAASADGALRQRMVQAFHGGHVRVYANDDVVGVEVGGAVKNVMAIATGLCDGLGLGLNARAALITRGLAEMARLGVALGAKPDTFMGLSGLGDLVLTATGDLSRNRQVGLLLAQGMSTEQAVASLGHVAEGVYSAQTVALRAQRLGVPMPITDAVVALLQGHLSPQEAFEALMRRDPGIEAVS
jgi:glycerol-3-phosphate dehydrogenase (NAD(P)+)